MGIGYEGKHANGTLVPEVDQVAGNAASDSLGFAAVPHGETWMLAAGPSGKVSDAGNGFGPPSLPRAASKTPMGQLLSEVDATTGNTDLNGLAVKNYNNAKMLYEFSTKMRTGGDTVFAGTYRDMADNYMAAGDYARRSASAYTTYTTPMWSGLPPVLRTHSMT